MNRDERRAFGLQLRKTIKGMAVSGLENLAEKGAPIAMSVADEVGGHPQHLSVIVCVDPDMSGVLTELIQEMLLTDMEEEGEEAEEAEEEGEE